MIAGLHGILDSLGSDYAIIDVNGVCFQVYMPTSTLTSLGTTGKEVNLHTHLIMREDGIILYGFGSTEELELFKILIGVSGLGPRLGLAILSTMNVEQVTMAIATGSIELLTTIPGIGKKMAERLIVELKDKIGAGLITTPATYLAQENADVLAALTSLGYSVSEASRAIASLPPSSSNLSLEERVRLALQYLGAK